MAVKSGFILLVTHDVPYPPLTGIELRVFKLLKWLKAEGYRVILALPVESVDAHALQELLKVTFAVHWTKPALRTRLGKRFPDLRRLLWEPIKPFLNPPVLPNPNSPETQSSVADDLKKGICPDRLINLVAKLSRRYCPQAVIVEYVFMTPCFAALPAHTLRIIDTVDVLSRKKDQVLAFGIDDPFACTEAEERQHLLQADVIVAIQAKEAEILKTLVPERKVILTTMDFETPSSFQIKSGKSDTILVVGASNDRNIYGLQAFLQECWPEIKTNHPAARLHVVGKVGDKCRIDDQSIQYTPRVDDLAVVYREARVVINPTIAGTGLKVKSVEALAHGRPLVAWPNGVEGLEYADEPPFIECHSWQEFGSAVVRLLRSDTEVETLASRALSYVRDQFSASKVYASLGTCLLEHTSRNVELESAEGPVRATFQRQVS